jgi:hypothetical protein
MLEICKDGFRISKDYLPILSRVIKITRFMIIKKVIELSDELEKEKTVAELSSFIDNID